MGAERRVSARRLRPPRAAGMEELRTELRKWQTHLTRGRGRNMDKRAAAWAIGSFPIALAAVFALLNVAYGMPPRFFVILIGVALTLGVGHFLSYRWFFRHYPDKVWLARAVYAAWAVASFIVLAWLAPRIVSWSMRGWRWTPE